MAGLTEVLPPKVSLFGVDVTPCTYESATGAIMAAAREGRSFASTALATHGLVHAARHLDFARVVNSIDLVTPDGQPVKWALNALLGAGLEDRVYGPTLTEWICAACEREGVGIYLFGSTPQTCSDLQLSLNRRFPGLRVVGVQPDRFREATEEEDQADVARITASGAGVVLVGRGCPRQERWVESHRGRIPAATLAVGAAFDYLAGTLEAPPAWMQDHGLEWLHRLHHDPLRLWCRYLVSNSMFMAYFAWAWLAKAPRHGIRRTRL